MRRGSSLAAALALVGCGGGGEAPARQIDRTAKPAVAAAPAPAPSAGTAVASVDGAALLAERVRAAEAAGLQVVPGEDGWLFFVPELRALAAGRFWGEDAARTSRATDAETRDPLPAILDFQAQLAALGIDLLFVPVPAKAAIYPERLLGAPPPAPLDGAHAEFLGILAGHGVRTLDLAAVYRAARAGDEGEPLYCRQDTHFSPRGAEVAAGAIATAVRPRLGEGHATGVAGLEVRESELEIEGDLWRLLAEPRPARERLRRRQVTWLEGGARVPLAPSRTSPVLLLADSHGLVFHAGAELHGEGAGLADHLARELGIAVDVLAVRGSGATPARLNLLRRGDGLEGKRVVVWVLSVREYSEGQGWKKVPVRR